MGRKTGVPFDSTRMTRRALWFQCHIQQMNEIHFAPRKETMVEAITFVAIFVGESKISVGFLSSVVRVPRISPPSIVFKRQSQVLRLQVFSVGWEGGGWGGWVGGGGPLAVWFPPNKVDGLRSLGAEKNPARPHVLSCLHGVPNMYRSQLKDKNNSFLLGS